MNIMNCSHLHCSGCPLRFNYRNPPLFEEAAKFWKKEFSLSLSLNAGEAAGFRTRAKLAVRGSAKDPSIGLFEEGSHKVIPIPSCIVHHPLINRKVEDIRKWMIAENIQPYNEQAHTGSLRYLQLTVELDTHFVETAMVVNEECPVFEGAWVNKNTLRTNTIWGPVWIEGEKWIRQKFKGREFYFHPGAFQQANLGQFDLMLGDIIEQIKPGVHVAEFFAGVGLIGLSVPFKELTMVESNPWAAASYAKHSHPLARYIEGNAFERGDLVQEVVILDPPRKGAGEKLLHKVSEAEQIIYVSCHFESLAKDALILKKNGFKVQFLKSYLFFPGTNHIETLAIFRKSY
jgi:tRNA/tmRNA/rRNA uracil-C5-methylase (TrmA/RlmC/RlmD family)